MIGGTLFTLFLCYIWLFVGSSRPDGVQQMRILFWLIIGFGSGTLITAFQYAQAQRTAIRWRDGNSGDNSGDTMQIPGALRN